MRARTSLSIFLVVLALLSVESCAESPAPKPAFPDYAAFKNEELLALAESDPESCMEAISIIASTDTADTAMEHAGFKDIAAGATAALSGKFQSSVGAGRWKESERYYSSLEAIASLRLPVFDASARIAEKAISITSIADIYLGIAETYLDRKLYSPAMAYFLKALDSVAPKTSEAGSRTFSDRSPLPPESLAGWAERALMAGDAVSFRRLEPLLPAETTASLRKKYPSALPDRTIAERVAGVVTVSVDKGLKIENGLGYPDRILGTAFQVDPQGYYLTNYHVVASEVDPKYNGYSKLSIRPSGNPDARIPAKVVGWDEDLDLALLKSAEVSPHTFYLSRFGQADNGQRVYAIGSPVGLENSITTGIVSATGRRFLPRGEAIQIDAPVNPGNSGGPLLDADGNLIGLVFAGLSGFQGLNFALPASWISTIFSSLFDVGKVEKPWLGVAAARNLDSSLDLAYVYPGNGGLQPGDTLLSIDGRHYANIQGAQMIVSLKPLNSLSVLKLRRKNTEVVLLHKLLPVPSKPFKKALQSDSTENLLEGGTGMILDHVSGPRGPGGSYKVAKTWPGMTADESGIAEGDVIKFLRFSADTKEDRAFFDISVKSTTTGYLERSMRLSLSLEMANFI